jgi:hypothetical protein
MTDFADAALLANEAELTKAYNQLQKARGTQAPAPVEPLSKAVNTFADGIAQARVTAAVGRLGAHAPMGRAANLDTQRAAVRHRLQKHAAAAGVAVPEFSDEQVDAAIRRAGR